MRRVGKKYDEVKRGELKWEEVKKHRAVEKTCEKREGPRSGAAVERGGGKARTNSENSCEASLHFL